MSNKQKKRTKRYQGEDAKQNQAVSSQPVVHRYEAVERSKAGEWWNGKKRIVRLGAIVSGVAVGGGWLIFELFRVVF